MVDFKIRLWLVRDVFYFVEISYCCSGIQFLAQGIGLVKPQR